MKPKVYLNGTENIGWAMDEEMEHVRKALDGKVQFTSLESAEIVHSVYWWKLVQLPPHSLMGKKVICSLSQKPYFELSEPLFSPVSSLVNCLVAKSSQAVSELKSVGINARHISYSVDNEKFTKEISAQKKDSLLKKWAIPNDKYILGNFHRDSEGGNLFQPKIQKGPEILLEIAIGLKKVGVPVHLLLAGPRRHWSRRELGRHGIGYTFIGNEVDGEDNHINVLNRTELGELYHLIDCYVISSRWEGGPHSALEAAASFCKVISTPVGVALDVLEPNCIYRKIDDAVQILRRDWEEGTLSETLNTQYLRVQKYHTIEVIGKEISALYDQVQQIPTNRIQVVNYLNRSHFWDRVLTKIPFTNVRRISFRATGLEFLAEAYGWDINRLISAFVEDDCLLVENERSSSVHVSYITDNVTLKKANDTRKQIIWLSSFCAMEIDPIIVTQICQNKRKFLVVESAWCLRQLYQRGANVKGAVAIIPESIFGLQGRPECLYRALRVVLGENVIGDFIEEVDIVEERHVSFREGDIYICSEGDCRTRRKVIDAINSGVPVIYPEESEFSEFVGYGGESYRSSSDIGSALELVMANYERYCRLIMVPDLQKFTSRVSEMVKSLDLND